MIKHLVMDVDGVLNTGQFLYGPDGKAYKVFGPHDRDGLKIIQSLGITIDFISADKTGWNITLARLSKDWGFSEKCMHLVTEEDRLSWVRKKYNMDELAFIGDGIHDAPIILEAKIGIAPISGRREAKAVADYITESPAGSGAVLDACLYIREYNENL